MAIAKCPHCGLKVHFGQTDVCPSCGIGRDAPVTAEDEKRIAQVAETTAAHASQRGLNTVEFGKVAAVGGGSVVVVIALRLLIKVLVMIARSDDAPPLPDHPEDHRHDAP